LEPTDNRFSGIFRNKRFQTAPSLCLHK
jgi:hypothetical protein